MNPLQWMEWIHEWFTQHPLREPPTELREQYTREVMQRLAEPQRVFRPAKQWITMPRLAWAFSAVAACALVVAVWGLRPAMRLASHGQTTPLAVLQLAQELPAEPDDATWVEETAELLMETESGDSDWEEFLSVDRVTDEELLEELQRLEELEQRDT